MLQFVKFITDFVRWSPYDHRYSDFTKTICRQCKLASKRSEVESCGHKYTVCAECESRKGYEQVFDPSLVPNPFAIESKNVWVEDYYISGLMTAVERNGLSFELQARDGKFTFKRFGCDVTSRKVRRAILYGFLLCPHPWKRLADCFEGVDIKLFANLTGDQILLNGVPLVSKRNQKIIKHHI